MNRIFRAGVMPAALLFIAACGNGGHGGKGAGQAGTEQETQLNKVVVDTAVVRDVPHTESYTSTVLPFAVNNIAPMQGARIEKINAEIGDWVRAGQVLVEAGTLKLEQSELKFKNDGVELERMKSLYKEGGISQSDYEAAALAYDLSRKSLEDLRENTVVASPITGVVTARNCDAGDVYAMGQPVLVVQQITPVKLLVGISEADYTRIRRGDEVRIRADALPDKEFTGRISRIYPTIDALTRTVPVEVTVPNRDRQLRPGMYAKVDVTFEVRHSVVVPDRAVVRQLGSAQRIIYRLAADRTVSAEIVETGSRFGDCYEILSGISEGDVVVVRGHSRLKSGDKVEVIDE